MFLRAREHGSATLFDLCLQEDLASELRLTSLHRSLALRLDLNTTALVTEHPSIRDRFATVLEVAPGWELGKYIRDFGKRSRESNRKELQSAAHIPLWTDI